MCYRNNIKIKQPLNGLNISNLLNESLRRSVSKMSNQKDNTCSDFSSETKDKYDTPIQKSACIFKPAHFNSRNKSFELQNAITDDIRSSKILNML